MSAQTTVYRERLMAMGQAGGPIYVHWVRTLMRVDARAKYYLNGVLVNKRTGNLLSSQAPPVVAMVGDNIVGALQNNASYAAAVHNGQKAHEIRARNVRFLRFDPGGAAISAAGTGGGGRESSGGVVFRQTVQHPGTVARPFLRDALRDIVEAPSI